MKVYGHRGASGIMPENTMMAYQKALEFGADGFELDVQRTGDGGLVIFHDDVMARTARWTVDDLVFGGIKGEPVRGHIYDYPTKVLREEIEVGSWKSPDFAGAQIPLMEEVFQWMTTNQIAINVEVKVPIDSYRSFLTIDTVRLAQQYGLTGRLIVSSFYHPALLDVKRTDPSIDCGVLSSDDLVEPGRYVGLVGAQAYHPHFLNINKDDVDECHALGKAVNVWTPNSEEDLKRCIRMGVDTVITNYPDRALALLGR
ncbi:MAG TPA: hypothetical protein DEP00_03805 [Lachnospiraceae bacterium]|nr:hypothetical protein [Lachnospiraceae bacterium]